MRTRQLSRLTDGHSLALFLGLGLETILGTLHLLVVYAGLAVEARLAVDEAAILDGTGALTVGVMRGW